MAGQQLGFVKLLLDARLGSLLMSGELMSVLKLALMLLQLLLVLLVAKVEFE